MINEYPPSLPTTCYTAMASICISDMNLNSQSTVQNKTAMIMFLLHHEDHALITKMNSWSNDFAVNRRITHTHTL